MLLTTARGRGVPRDTFPAQGTHLAASNILGKFAFVKHKMEPKSSFVICPGDRRSRTPQHIYGKGAKSPPGQHTSPGPWSHPTGSDLRKPASLQHACTQIQLEAVCDRPVNWQLWFQEGKTSVKASWWNPWVFTSSSKAGQGGENPTKKKKQPAFFSKVLSVSVHCCL